MKPPVCHLCGQDFVDDFLERGGGGDVVRFKDYQPLPEDMGGHPLGAEWFCTKHEVAARKLSGLSLRRRPRESWTGVL